MLLQRQTTSLRPLTTAHLAQTMSLLELNNVELRQQIESQLANNPALELVDEHRCPTCQRIIRGKHPCPFCSQHQSPTQDQTIVFLSNRSDFYSSYKKATDEDDDFPDDNQAPITETLEEYVLRQVITELNSEDLPIAVHALTCLDEDGLLNVSVAEIAQYHHVTRSRVEQVLHTIQNADPLGVGAPTPQDALLTQLEVLAETHTIPPKAFQAIQAGMEYLNPHRCVELGHILGIHISEAKAIVEFISDNLNPYPARAHWGDHGYTQVRSSPQNAPYHFPDIIITRLNGLQDTPLIVEIGMPFDGALRVNPLFREALAQAPDEKARLWQSDIEQASLLVKCLQQRNQAIIRLMQRLTIIQREFILWGDAFLHPLTRAKLAEELDVHESTISRAVSNKRVQLLNKKIVPLSMFFDRSLHVRAALKDIISQETIPLSDTQLVAMLSQQGFPLARRTVAKYRSMEGILPAHLRAHTHPA